MINSYYIPTRYGRDWTISANDEIMEDRYKAGEFCEQMMLDWIMKNVTGGGLWIDAGANIGNHAMVFSTVADRVIAFEPIAENHRLLVGNIEYNDIDNVSCVMLGVGDEECEMAAVPGGTGKPCQITLQPGEGGIQVTTIDRFLTMSEPMPVRLIKIDVEGMEGKAIIGALETINRWKPELFVEIWEEDQLTRIRAVLATIGYKLIERWNHAPTYHFSASGRYPVTYTAPLT